MSGPYHINKYPIERQDGVDLARLASVKMDAMVKALRDAKAFMIIEQLSPAVHSFEIEKRNVFREQLFDQIDTAIHGVVGKARE